jgi:SpoVK/Ycf46/Vps4 family AAA+-type ATPase
MARIGRGRMRQRYSGARIRPLQGELSLWALRLWVAVRERDSTDWLLAKVKPDTLLELGVDFGLDGSGEVDDAPGPEQVDRLLLNALDRSERNQPAPFQPRIHKNLSTLVEHLGLTETERQILLFLLFYRSEADFEALVTTARKVVSLGSTETFSAALGIPEDEICRALSREATLIRSGLIEFRCIMGFDAESFEYDLLDGLTWELMRPTVTSESVFRDYFRPSPEPSASLVVMSHLQGERRRMAALIAEAAQQRLRGINVLLYGPPGTGKTQLARQIAREAQLGAVEVNFEADSGEPLLPGNRQRAYQLCQHVLGRTRGSMVIFDEIEDVFEDRVMVLRQSGRPHQPGGKAWTNQMLEENPVPAIWISNHVNRIDRAYLRRFDYTLEVIQPPRSVRHTLLEEARGSLPISDDWIHRVADLDGVTPAEVHSAMRMAHLLHDQESDECLGSFLEEHLSRQGRLQRRTPPLRRRGAGLLHYDIEHLNPDQPLEPVVRHLARASEGSLLLYGVPGTGKTALANHLAKESDRPLIHKPASELISPYVGETEQNIARLFQNAKNEGAMVLLDEADSLVGNRETARARWEVSETNEVLVQIESFHGVVICATNFLDAVDGAALRRFDYKIELRALNLDQRLELFDQLARTLSAQEDCSAQVRERSLSRLDNLTPGDFATIARRFHQRSFEGAPNHSALLDALQQESQIKPGAGRRRASFA